MADERQYGETLADIRGDHVQRYQHAALFAQARCMRVVFDMACGCGYGAWVMAAQDWCADVFGLDNSLEAINFAFEHYHSRAATYEAGKCPATGETLYVYGDALNPICWPKHMEVELITAFEFLEHIDDPGALVRELCDFYPGRAFLCSTPNEVNYPHVNPSTGKAKPVSRAALQPSGVPGDARGRRR